jgi:hypothetical protein
MLAKNLNEGKEDGEYVFEIRKKNQDGRLKVDI